MRVQTFRRGMVPLVLGMTFGLVVPAQGFAKAVVRIVHGVPGVGRATVKVTAGGTTSTVGSIGFGQATRWATVPAGRFTWSLSKGAKTLASGDATVGNGAYDIVALEVRSKVKMEIYKAQGGKPGTSEVRVIHGAPEFGAPSLLVDGKLAVKKLSYTQATPYVSLPAGAHTFAAVKPGTTTPLISAKATTQAGRSYSAVVLGTRGEKVRVLTLVDRGAPAAPVTTDVAKRRETSGAGRSGATLMVKSGDSLWSIARSLVGPGASNGAVERRLVAIWDANRSVIGTGNPNLIYPGTKLHV